MIVNDDILRVPFGNDFRLHICYKNVVPSEEEGISFADIEDMVVVLKRFPDISTSVDYELTDEGDIMITLPSGMLAKSLYSLEMTGTYDGHPWRWKALPLFRIVNANACDNVHGLETFGEETYYVDDTLEAEIDGDTLTLTTHGHASLQGGVLTLQSGNTFDIDIINKTATIIYGYQQNRPTGQAWKGHCI